MTVDPSADRHPVSPHVFGVNFASGATLARMRYPANRWGGNSTTRYSWTDDTGNRAADWFFFNIPEDNPNPSTLPDGSSADAFVDDTRAAGAEPLLTVPTIGWTPKDRAKRWGYSVAKYGPQQQTECTATGGASWCQPDAGNGRRASDGVWITGNDPADTSRPVGPSFVTDWMQHLATRAATLGHAGVRCELEAPFEFPPTPVSAAVRHNLFMATQEALNNAVKHGRPSRVRLRVAAAGNRLSLSLEDDGCGFNPAARLAGRNGLENMRQRLESVGGSFQLTSAPGRGTRIHFDVALGGT